MRCYKLLKNTLMETKYRVRIFQDNTYEVIEKETGDSMFQGTLADCEAWIRLEVGGYF
jgi:hypothetical protein